MSELRFCGNCGLDLQAIPHKFARRYRRDPTRCPRCHALTIAEAFTLRRQNTAERLAAGPLRAPDEPEPPPIAVPQRHVGIIISMIAASLVTVIILLATLVLLGVITLPRSFLATSTHTVAATSPTSVPTMLVMSTTPPTNVVTGTPTIMTIQPYAITADCSSITSAATTTLANVGTTALHWSAAIVSQGGGVVPFQLVPLSGDLLPHAAQTLTLSEIVNTGTVVVTANGVSESIIVSCTPPAVTPTRTVPAQ